MKKYRSVGQIVAFIALFAAFVFVVHQFIIPVVFGLLVSLVFRPIYVWLLDRIGNRPRLTALASTLLVFCLVLIPLILITTYVVKDVANLAKVVNDASSGANQDPEKVGENPVISKLYGGINKIYPMSPAEFRERVRSSLDQLAKGARSLVGGVLGTIPRAATSLIFFMIALYFGLVDGPRLAKFFKENSPFPVRETDIIFRTTHGICNAVVVGALLAGLVQGTIIGLGYWILGIPKPLFFGALTALFGLIPLVGSAPTGIGGALYLLATGKVLKAIIMMIIFAIAGISDNIIKPMVLKGRMSLHPFLGLLSVLGGIKAFGFAGIFLGPVITALTITLILLFQHRVKTQREKAAEPATE